VTTDRAIAYSGTEDKKVISSSENCTGRRKYDAIHHMIDASNDYDVTLQAQPVAPVRTTTDRVRKKNIDGQLNEVRTLVTKHEFKQQRNIFTNRTKLLKITEENKIRSRTGDDFVKNATSLFSGANHTAISECFFSRRHASTRHVCTAAPGVRRARDKPETFVEAWSAECAL